MFQEREGCPLFCPGPTVRETHRGGDEGLACRCYATVRAACICVAGGGGRDVVDIARTTQCTRHVDSE